MENCKCFELFGESTDLAQYSQKLAVNDHLRFFGAQFRIVFK